MAKKKTLYQPNYIPFEEITAVASRNSIRANKDYITGGRQVQNIHVDMIRIREGFNFRRRPEGITDEDWETRLKIPELAESLLAGNEPTEIIRGDFNEDASIFMLSDGYRRYLAHMRLLRDGVTEFPNGAAVHLMEALPNPKGFTEVDRARQVFTSQNNLQLGPMELGYGFLQMKQRALEQDGEEISNEQIADLIGGVSRQWVDNMIMLTKLPVEKQTEVENGMLKVTHALTWLRNSQKTPKSDGGKPGPVENTPQGASEALQSTRSVNTDESARLSGEAYTAAERVQSVDEMGLYVDAENIMGALGGFTSQAYDKDSASDAEWDSRKTDSKFREQRPKNDQDDALPSMDFKKQKTEAEMDLNECIKSLDRVRVGLDKVPEGMKQSANDWIGILITVQRKMEGVIEVIKKAADKI